MKKIGVIGAGWLGMDFVNRISKEGKFYIRYTNRTKSTEENCFAFSFGEKLPKDFIQNFDFLFITSTLPKDGKEQLEEFVKELKQKINGDCKLVFTSTIGVYAAETGLVNEEDSELKQTSIYSQFEQLLTNNFPNQVIVLRLGGLIGQDRHPVFSLSGRKNIPDGQKGVNLVHKEDIVRFFTCILQDEVLTGMYNLVFPDHPLKKNYYTEQAIKNNILIPEFEEGTEHGKIVCSKKSQQIKGFEYQNSI